MIVWLASYPRSGNTLLRTLIHRVFGLPTHSVYDDRGDIGADDATRKAVGHEFLGGTWEERYPQLRDAAEVSFVKTHDGPFDDAKAVYVVRDPRSAIASYFHYMKDFRPDWAGCSIRDVASGLVPFGPWSYHLDRWNPLGRPRTLLIRYEELLCQPQRIIEQLAQFCYLPVRGQWHNDFEALHRVNPRFFRQGSVTFDRSEYDPDTLYLLDALHGDWMDRLGYERGEHARYFTVEHRAYRAVIFESGTRLDQLRVAKEQMRRELGRAAARLVEVALAEQQHLALQTRCSEIERALAQTNAAHESAQAQVVAKDRQIAAVQAQLAARETQIAAEINRLAAKENETAGLQRQLAEQARVLEAEKASRQALLADLARATERAAGTAAALQAETEQVALRTAERDAAAASLTSAREEIARMAAALAEKEAAARQLARQAESAQAIIAQLRAALAQFDDIGPLSLRTVRRLKRLLHSFPRTQQVARRIVHLAVRGRPSRN